MARRELHVFYVLDTSGSMRGLPIATLNRAMGESMLALKQVAAKNGNAKVKVAVLEFNSTCRWMQPAGPEEMEDFVWRDLHAGGLTYMGAALRELNDKLSKTKFLKSSTGVFAPVIIFMTDGFANDDYKSALRELEQNELYSQAIKVGFTVGTEADVQMIAELTGDEKAVLASHDLEAFADLLVFVTQSSSTISVLPVEGVRQGSAGAYVVSQARNRHVGTSASSLGMARDSAAPRKTSRDWGDDEEW